MAEVFVDTSAWYPLSLRAHPDHRRVATVLREQVRLGSRVVTTNLVVAETHVLLRRRVGQQVALGFVRTVREAPNLVVTSSVPLEAAAVTDWLARFQDQAFSFTDAVSFAVMRERGIREALALDHHFRVAGFAVVPGRPSP